MLFCHLQAKLFFWVFFEMIRSSYFVHSCLVLSSPQRKCLALTWDELCVKVQEKTKERGNEVGVGGNPWG